MQAGNYAGNNLFYNQECSDDSGCVFEEDLHAKPKDPNPFADVSCDCGLIQHDFHSQLNSLILSSKPPKKKRKSVRFRFKDLSWSQAFPYLSKAVGPPKWKIEAKSSTTTDLMTHYLLKVEAFGISWHQSARYSDLYDLKEVLLKENLLNSTLASEFPDKTADVLNLHIPYVEARRQQLNKFFASLCDSTAFPAFQSPLFWKFFPPPTITLNSLLEHAFECQEAAVCIQHAWRQYFTKQRTKKKTKQSNSGQTLQWNRLVRVVLLSNGVLSSVQQTLCKEAEQLLQDTVLRVVKCQAVWRGHFSRHHFVPALIILSEQYQSIQRNTAAECIQARWKGFWARVDALRDIVSELAARRFVRWKSRQLALAASQIQNRWRTFIQRKRMLTMKKVATQAQALCRGHSARKHAFQLRRYKAAVIRVQTFSRSNITRQKFMTDRKAIIRIQALARSRSARRRAEHRLLTVIKLQSFFRLQAACVLVKNLKHQHASATKLQTCARAAAARHGYKQLLKKRLANAIKIQSHARKMAAHKKFRKWQNRNFSTTKIQKLFRGNCVRKAFYPVRDAARQVLHQKRTVAAIKIQAWIRCFVIRTIYTRIVRAARIIQFYVLDWLDRLYREREFNKINRACTLLQAAVRGYQHRGRLVRGIRAVMQLQALFRLRQEMFARQCEVFLVGVTRLQAVVRGIAGREHAMYLLEERMPPEEKIDIYISRDTPTRQLILANRKVLHNIFNGYIIYPEQSMTKSKFIEFGRQFQILPRLIAKKQVEDLVDRVTSMNKHKQTDALVSFEQFLKLLLLIAQSSIGIEHVFLTPSERNNQQRALSYKFSILLERMDESDGKKKIAKNNRIHEHIYAFMYLGNPNLPEPGVAKGARLFGSPMGGASANALKKRGGSGRRAKTPTSRTSSIGHSEKSFTSSVSTDKFKGTSGPPIDVRSECSIDTNDFESERFKGARKSMDLEGFEMPDSPKRGMATSPRNRTSSENSTGFPIHKTNSGRSCSPLEIPGAIVVEEITSKLPRKSPSIFSKLPKKNRDGGSRSELQPTSSFRKTSGSSRSSSISRRDAEATSADQQITRHKSSPSSRKNTGYITPAQSKKSQTIQNQRPVSNGNSGFRAKLLRKTN